MSGFPTLRTGVVWPPATLGRAPMLLLAALMMHGALALQEPANFPKRGLWGAATVALDEAYFTTKDVVAPSPDGRSWATARGDQDKNTFEVELSGAIGHGVFNVAAGPNQELLWSPDSRALFVTADDGGLVGSYELTVIGLSHGKLIRRDLTKWLSEEFGHPCQAGYVYNVAGVSWLNSSRRLLAVVEVPDDSGCPNMGLFRTYEVEPFKRRLLRRFDQHQTQRMFPSILGPVLRESPVSRSP